MTAPRQFLHERLYRGENFDRLADKVVVACGCGAIGSWTAIMLARMGIRNFRLIDKDRVEIHNVSTQAFTPQNVGQYKTRALQEHLYRISKARCETHPVELNGRNALSLLSNCDLVICSFDNKKSKEIVKAECLKNRIPCMFSAMNGEEVYFEIIWAESYNPPDDPIERDIDPCNYPMSTTLVTTTASITAEIAIQYLLNGMKQPCRLTLKELLR
jgi:molybdopterin/thiamine biosynthesis adenylyltransferase